MEPDHLSKGSPTPIRVSAPTINPELLNRVHISDSHPTPSETETSNTTLGNDDVLRWSNHPFQPVDPESLKRRFSDAAGMDDHQLDSNYPDKLQIELEEMEKEEGDVGDGDRSKPIPDTASSKPSRAGRLETNEARWDSLRDDIRRLYLDEDKRFPDVMESIEATHGFKAS